MRARLAAIACALLLVSVPVGAAAGEEHDGAPVAAHEVTHRGEPEPARARDRVEEAHDLLAGLDDAIDLRRPFRSRLLSDARDEGIQVLSRVSKEWHVRFVRDDDRVRDVRVLIADSAR